MITKNLTMAVMMRKKRELLYICGTWGAQTKTVVFVKSF